MAPCSTFLIVAVSLLTLTVNAAAKPLWQLETELLKELFGGNKYDKEIIPQRVAGTPIIVSMQFVLAYVLEINEKEGRIVTSFYPTMSWVDERLKWETSPERPFNKTTVLADKLWLPDIEVFNSVVALESSNVYVPRVYIYKNGTVSYTLHKVLHTPCEMNLIYFPFDTQHCMISMGSWSADTSVIDMEIKRPSANVSFYTDHQSWRLEKYDLTKLDYHYGQTNETYTTLLVSLQVKRKGTYYYRLFVAPAAVCMFVIPVLHFLPPSSNEKLTLGGLILVAVTVMFEMVEDFFPPFSIGAVPLILHYYTALLVILFMSLLLSCLSVMVGTGESKSSRVPRFLRICCIDRLGYVCCARGRTSRYDYELLHLEKALRYSATRQSSREEDERELTEVSDDNAEGAAAANHNHSQSGQKDEGMTEVLKTLINELQYARYKEQVKSEWLQLAMVLDRTGGLLLLALAIIITAVITLHSG